jgi:hypothetical protein
MLERLDLTVGILAGQQVVERDAGGVEVVRRAGLVAGEQFRRHVARRSRAAGGGLVFRQAERDAEVEDAQVAVAADVDVRGFDVAMGDVESVQGGEPLHQPDAVLDGVGDGEMETGVEHPLQRCALVPGLQVVEATALVGRYELREEG